MFCRCSQLLPDVSFWWLEVLEETARATSWQNAGSRHSDRRMRPDNGARSMIEILSRSVLSGRRASDILKTPKLNTRILLRPQTEFDNPQKDLFGSSTIAPAAALHLSASSFVSSRMPGGPKIDDKVAKVSGDQLEGKLFIKRFGSRFTFLHLLSNENKLPSKNCNMNVP